MAFSPSLSPNLSPQSQTPPAYGGNDIRFDATHGQIIVGQDRYNISILGQAAKAPFTKEQLAEVTTLIKNLFVSVDYHFSDLDGVIIGREDIFKEGQQHKAIESIKTEELFQKIDTLVQQSMPVATPSNPLPSQSSHQAVADFGDEPEKKNLFPLSNLSEPPSLHSEIADEQNPQTQPPLEKRTQNNPKQTLSPAPEELPEVKEEATSLTVEDTSNQQAEKVSISVKESWNLRKWIQLDGAKLLDSFSSLLQALKQKFTSITLPKFPSFWKKEETNLPKMEQSAAKTIVASGPIITSSQNQPSIKENPDFNIQTIPPDQAIGAIFIKVVKAPDDVSFKNQSILSELINELANVETQLANNQKARIQDQKLVFKSRKRGLKATKHVGTSNASKKAVSYMLDKMMLAMTELRKLDPTSSPFKESYREIDQQIKGIMTSKWYQAVLNADDELKKRDTATLQALAGLSPELLTEKYLSKEDIFAKAIDPMETPFKKTFLLGYRSLFMPSESKNINDELLNGAMSARFLMELHKHFKQAPDNHQKISFLNLLSEWVNDPTLHGGDVQKALVQNVLKTIIEDAKLVFPVQVKEIEDKLNTKAVKFPHYDKLQPSKTRGFFLTSLGLINGESVKDRYTALDRDSRINLLVDDLTTYSTMLFQNISLQELCKCGWSKEQKADSSPNVLALIRFSNNLTNYVAHQILLEDPKRQSEMIRFCLDTAKKCHENGDFNSAQAILAAFQAPHIHRFPIVEEILKDYKSITTPYYSSEKNFKLLKDEINKQKVQDKPFIPPLGLFLTDITFLEDGNPDTNSNGQFNQFKIKKLAEIYGTIADQQKKLELPLSETGNISLNSDIHVQIAEFDRQVGFDFSIKKDDDAWKNQEYFISQLIHQPKDWRKPQIVGKFFALTPTLQASLMPYFIKAFNQMTIQEKVTELNKLPQDKQMDLFLDQPKVKKAFIKQIKNLEAEAKLFIANSPHEKIKEWSKAS